MSYLLRGTEIDACLHRVALERLIDARAALTPEQERRRDEAARHRRRVYDVVLAHHADAREVRGERETVDAIRQGTSLILTPRLTDPGEGRIASIQGLVRVGRSDDGFHYAPIVVKNHEVIEPSSTRHLLEGDLTNLTPGGGHDTPGVGLRTTPTVRRDGLLLSGATRILQALGASDPSTRGLIIDRQQRVWWLDLAAAHHHRFNLDTYDGLYRERRAVLDALRETVDRLPTEPYWHRDCATCPFAERCEAELDQRDDVSLTRFTSLAQQYALRERGITTRRDLASLDPVRAARARTRGRTEEHAGTEEVLGASIEKLEELIYRARAHVRGTMLRKVGVDELRCPTADVEVDVDMESYEDQTYLWGASVRVRRAIPGVEEGYHAFVTWEFLTSDAEATLFAAFWRWFGELRERVRAHEATFAAYCFWAAAEDGAMNRAVRHPREGGPTMADLEAFRTMRPAEWIDMHEVVTRRIQTEGPTGLKQMASAAGFAWRDENPSGEASILWYEEAVGADPVRARAARDRLLAYNEDDCRATAALRDWLHGPAMDLPHRDDPIH